MSSRIILAVLPLLLLPLSAALGANLQISVVDEQGEPVWSRLLVQDENGKFHQYINGLRDQTSRSPQSRGAEYLGHFIARGPFTMELPAGTYTVTAEHGPEYEAAVGEIEVAEDSEASLTLPLVRWIDMSEIGFLSADFHVHRSREDVPTLLEAEDLDLAVVLTLWNKRDDLYGQWPQNPVVELPNGRYMTTANAEDERGGGAWMLHMLRERVELGDHERWFPTGLDVISEAVEQRYVPRGFPWVDVEKPFWKEAPVVMALAAPNSVGLLHNHFLQFGILDDEAWGMPRNVAAFPRAEGFVDASLELNYRYWNLGFAVAPTAGSASGVLPNPVGYNRLYVQLNEPFSGEAFYRNLRQGRAFVTNGPMLFFDAYEAPGEQILVQLDVKSRAPLDRVEVIADGEVIQSFEAPEGKTEFKTDVAVRGGIYTWIAARAFEKNDKTVRMAHSKPVFFPGSRDHSEDAAFFVEWIDKLIAETEGDEERISDPKQREHVLEQYREARKVYADMM